MIDWLQFKLAYRYEPETGLFFRGKTKKAAGRVATNGYRQIAFQGKRYMAHRLAWFYVHKVFPDGQLDHINHDKDDNRIENLREVNQSQNFENVHNWSHNKTGRRGVSFAKGRYQADIKVNRKTLYLGSYDNIVDAVAARMRGEREYFTLLNYAPVYERITNEAFSPMGKVPVRLGPWAPEKHA